MMAANAAYGQAAHATTTSWCSIQMCGYRAYRAPSRQYSFPRMATQGSKQKARQVQNQFKEAFSTSKYAQAVPLLAYDPNSESAPFSLGQHAQHQHVHVHMQHAHANGLP